MTTAKTMQELWQDSYLASGNESYLEDLYETYLSDPQAALPLSGVLILNAYYNLPLVLFLISHMLLFAKNFYNWQDNLLNEC